METKAPAARARSASSGAPSSGLACAKSNGRPVATMCQYSPTLVPMAWTSAPIRVVKWQLRSLRVSAIGQSNRPRK